MDVTICVSTYGEDKWRTLAKQRAIPSAEQQGGPVVYHHGSDTLAKARNDALAQVETEWVCFLDADDELEYGYIDAISKGSADLRGPAIRQIVEDGSRRIWGPFVPKVYNHYHRCEADCLRVGNWLVVGTVAPTALIREVGGWEEWLWSEDWALWARCWKAGATVEAIPNAIYRAHWYPESRNRAASRLTQAQQHRNIELAVWGSNVDPSTHPAYARQPLNEHKT